MTQLLNVHEVAERLRLSRWTVYELVRAGKLPAVRLTGGGKLLFRSADVELAVERATRAEPVTA